MGASVPSLAGLARPGEGQQRWRDPFPPASVLQRPACGSHRVLPGLHRWPFLSAARYITSLWLSSRDPPCTLAAKGVVYLLHQFCAIPKQKRDYLQISPHKNIPALLCSGEISPKSSVVTFEFRAMSMKVLQEF